MGEQSIRRRTQQDEKKQLIFRNRKDLIIFISYLKTKTPLND